MFYFEQFKSKTVLKSDYLAEVNHFFTTREGFDFTTLEVNRVVNPVQTHSDNVDFLDERNDYPNTDGLILKEKDTAIYLRFADCTPLIFYNPITKIGAISHAGWRGTAQRIGVKTIQKMGGNPKDIIAIIGPAISLCCYEVSEDVKSKLLSTVQDCTGLSNGMKVNLKGINAQQLREIGVEKIDICPYCTSCNNDKFYSYRKENGTSDRHFAVLSFKN